MRHQLLLAAAMAYLAGAGCAKTKFRSVHTTHPDGSVTHEWGGELGGNYGLVPKVSKRGNLGGGGRGGLLGAILPGFDYEDAHEREFYEAAQPTAIHMGPEGLTIAGPVDHSTASSIRGDAYNRAVRNVSTLVGWLGALDTTEAIHAANEATKRLSNNNATKEALRAGDNRAAVDLKRLRLEARPE